MIVPTASEFLAGFIARTQQLREESDLTQEKVATALGVPIATYKMYESRTPLPLFLIERFCIIVRCDVEHLVTGKQRPQTRRKPRSRGNDDKGQG
jgi:DNA-binding XRE family transcriptional regulator